MTKKRIICVLVCVIVCLCILGIYVAVKNVETATDSYGPYKGNSSPMFQEAYQRANDKQRRQLTNIQVLPQLSGDYTRQIMMIMGDLPQNTPRLTLSEVEKICESIKKEYDPDNMYISELEQIICQRFNEIAGAPDFEGGSGIGRSIYYLDDTGSKRIMVILGTVVYWQNDSVVEKLLDLTD